MQASSAGGVSIYGRTRIWHSTLAMFLVTCVFFLHVNVQYILITYLICIFYLWVRVFWLTLIRSSHYNDNEAHFNPPSILQFLMWWFFRHYSFFLVYRAAYRCPKTCCFYWKKWAPQFWYSPILSFIDLFLWLTLNLNHQIIYIYIYIYIHMCSVLLHHPHTIFMRCFSLPIQQSIRPSSPSRCDLWKRFHVPQMVGLTYGDFVLFLWSKLLDHIFWWGCNGCHQNQVFLKPSPHDMYHMFSHLLMTLFAVRGGYPKWRCAINVVINYPHHCKIRWVADIAPNGKVTTEFLFYVLPVAHPLTSRTCCFFPSGWWLACHFTSRRTSQPFLAGLLLWSPCRPTTPRWWGHCDAAAAESQRV